MGILYQVAMSRILAALLIVCCFNLDLLSQTQSNASGEWNDTGTWVGGVVPTSGDVEILTGHEIIYNADHGSSNAVTISSLDVQGTGSLVFPFSDDAELDANFTLTVNGGVTVASTASITNSEPNGGSIPGTATNRTHLFQFAGAIDNDGTIDLTGTTANRVVDADFQTNSFNVTGSGNWNFYNLDIEAGITIRILTTTPSVFEIENNLDLFNTTILEMAGNTFNVGLNNVDDAFDFQGASSTFTMTSGTANICTSATTNNISPLRVNADNCVLNVDGGALNIGNTATGEGLMQITNAPSTAFTFDIDGGTTTIADRLDMATTSSTLNLDISAGSLLIATGDGGGESGSSDIYNRSGNSTLNMTGGTLEFGENADFEFEPTLSGGATLSIGTNANVDTDFQVDFVNGGTWNITSAFTFVADGGLDIVANNTVNVGTGATLTIEQEDTDEPNVALQVYGTLVIDGGTVNVAENALTTLDADIVQIEDGGVININEGTMNIATSVTDGSQNTANFLQLDETTATLTIGDGAGGASTAVLNLGTSIVAQAPPTEEDLILINGNDATMTINSDGEVNVGAANVGSVLLNTDDNDTDADDFHLVVNGGTLNINGALDMRSGMGFQMTSGTTNIGLASSDGVNDIDFTNNTAGRDPTAPLTVEVTGGTLNVGDGAASIVVGDEDNNPNFGLATAYHELEFTGGTVNINGGLRLRDYNARLIMGNATINFDPQAINGFNEDLNVLDLEAGIVMVTGPVNINFLNPHDVTGFGEALFIQAPGSAADNAITESTAGTDPVDFSNVTWGFGDGSAANSSVDGFDISLDEGHDSYGSWVINNPSGSNRDVNLITTGNSYEVENVTITAGALDLGNNNFDADAASLTFEIAADGELKLNTDFPGHTALAFDTYTLATGSTVDYNGAATSTNAHVPDGTAFSNLTVSGGGTSNFGAANTVTDTVFLTSGTLAGSTFLTMGAGSVVSVADGSLTGTIQGSNAYTITYTGNSKSADAGTDGEWSGAGTQSLIVDLTSGQTMTFNNTALTLDDLSILSGTMTDVGLAHVVNGDLAVNDTYSGTGSLSLSGGASSHTLSSTGVATISNLIMNDANGASGDLSMTITNAMTLTDGILDVTSGTFTLSSGATISSGSSSTFIAFDGASSSGGMVQTYTSSTDSKTYPIGTGTDFTPFSMTLNSSSSFSTMTVLPVTGGSQFTLDGSNTLDLDYHWIVTDDGGFSSVDADYSYTYVDSDERGVEGNYISARYDVSNPEWTTSDETANGSDGVTPNTATLNGVDFTDGHFTAGEEDEFSGVITTFYLRGDLSEPLDWDDGTNWTNTDGGSTPINRTPGTNSPVIINREVSVNSDNQNAGSITLEASGTIIIDEDGSGNPTSGHTFGTVTGTGTLRLVSDDSDTPVFPDENAGNWSSFLSASGGTVVYAGDGNYTLPTVGGAYHNLTLTSTSAVRTKTLANEDLTITGDLLVTGGFGTTAAISDGSNGDISVAGTTTVASSDALSLGSTNNRTLTLTGDVTVAGTFDVANTGTATHSLSLGGSLTSTGTYDMNTGGSTVATTFNSADNESVTGAGTVDFDRLIVNVGSSTATSLTVDVTTFSVTDQGDNVSESSIEFQNGELILSTTADVILSNNGDVSIPSTSALTLNGAGNAKVGLSTSSAGNLALEGALTINSTDTLNIGDVTDQATDNTIFYDGTAGSITVNGGVLNVGGAIRPNVTDGSAALAFSLTNDGVVSLARNKSTNNRNAGATVNNAEGDFVLDNASSSFTMSGSGSILEVVRAEQADGKAISVSSSVTTYAVTEGKVKILQDAHDGFSSNSTGTGNDVAIYSSIPFYDLEIGDGDYQGDVGGANAGATTVLDLLVLDSLTINLNDDAVDDGRFDFFRVDRVSSQNEDEYNVEVGGDFTVISGLIQVNDDGTGGTVTFNGSGTQNFVTNGETFGDININSTGTVELEDALTISGDWTYTQGTLNQDGNDITMTNALGVATTINGTPTFDNLILSNTNGVTQASGTTTISASGVLTISDNVIYDLGDNGLIIQNQGTGSGPTTFAGISFSDVADATNMIRVSGNGIADGVTFTYPDDATSNFIFPIGATIGSDYYLPAQIDLTAGGGAGATVNVILVGSQHPQVTDTESALNLYWSVSQSGFDATQTADHDYTYGAVNGDLVEIVAPEVDDSNFRDAVNAGSPTFNWAENNGTVASQVISISDPGSDNISGDFTAGEDDAFNPVTVFYSLVTGDWNVTATWSNDECSEMSRSAAASTPTSSDPVVICDGNTVTITTATGLGASAIQIDGTLLSQIDDISPLNDISGSDSLVFNHTTATTPTFGTFGSDFLTSGTVEYGGTLAYTLPTQATYNNLVLSNAIELTLPNDISVTGDVNLTGDLLTMNTFNISDAAGTGTFTAAANTDIVVDGASNFPSGFNTYSLDATSNVTYSRNAAGQTIAGGITYGNLILSRTGGNPAPKTLGGDIVIAGDLTINDRTSLQASTFDIDIQGNWSMNTTGNSDFDPGTGIVTFSGGNAQTFTFTGAEPESFYDLTVDKSAGTLTFPTNINDVTVQNTLTVTDGTLQMDDVELVVEGSASTAAGGSITSNTTVDFNGDFTNVGTYSGTNTLTLAGNLSNSGTFTSDSTVFDNTTTAQSLTGATTFTDLTIAKASGVDITFNNAVTIDAILSLANEGNIVLSSGDLTISTTGSIIGDGSGSSVGDFSATRMIRTAGASSDPSLVRAAEEEADLNFFLFPIGVLDGTDKYTPVIVDADDGGSDNITSGSVSVKSINGNSTDQGVSGSAVTLNRHFYTDIAGLDAAVTFDIVFQYDDGDVVGDESDYLSAYSVRSSSDGWIRPSTSFTNVSAGTNQFGATTTSFSGATVSFSAATNLEWIAGDNDLINPRLYPLDANCVGMTCDWNTAGNWTTDDTGATSVGAQVPTSDNSVTILSDASVSISATASAQSIVVDGTLDFQNIAGNSLGEVTGTGTIQIDASGLDTYVDTGTGSTFFGENGGTVEYLGDAAYTLPSAFNEYNNLTIGGSTQNSHDKELGVNTLVFGNLNVGASDLENTGSFTFELRGSFPSSGGGNFNVQDGTFVFSNTATASIPSDLTFGSAGSLTLDNFGEKDLSGTLTIENLTFNSSSGNLDANSNNIVVTGNWDNQASGNLLTNPNNVTFNGADAQVIDGTNEFAAANISTSSTAVTVNSGTQTFTGALTLASGTSLNIGSNTIRVGSTLDVDAGTFTASSGRVVYTSTTDPESQVDAITVGTLEIDKGASTNTFDNDPATVTFNNLVVTSGEYDGPDLNIAGNLVVGSSGALDLTGITTMDIDGAFTVSGTQDFSGISTMTLAGNLTNNGTFSTPTTVTLDGSGDQTIGGSSSTTFTNLEVNNTSAGNTDVTINSNVTITTDMDFQEGIVVTSSGSLIFNDGATVSYDGVAEDVPTGVGTPNDGNSYVDGPVRKIGDDAFVFPTGDGSRFARIAINPASGSGTPSATDEYTAQYFFSQSGSANSSVPKGGDIVRVSGLEYWDVTNDNGHSGEPLLTLFWDGTSEVTQPATLVVAHFTGALWEDLGNGSTSGNASIGTITAASALTSFSEVTLATTNDGANPLPVQLLSFDGERTDNGIELFWSTAVEIDNEGFEVLHSTDGISMTKLDFVQGNGTSNERHFYEYTHKDPVIGTNFYQLRQMDYDGEYEDSPIINVVFLPDDFNMLLYPNPVGERMWLIMSVAVANGTYEIMDLSGRSVLTGTIPDDTKSLEFDLSRWDTGIYLLKVDFGGESELFRIVKE